MLRITKHDGPGAATLQLEGTLTGPWLDEFQQVWRSLAATLGSRKISIDLRGVTQMNLAAVSLLSEIYKRTGAEFIANNPMIEYFAEQARRPIEHPTKEEN